MAINYGNATAVVPEVLTGDKNYATWSKFMKNYLLAHDLWDIIESSSGVPTEDDQRKMWRKKNAAALHAIQITCSLASLGLIEEADAASDAWKLLAEKYKTAPAKGKGIVDGLGSDRVCLAYSKKLTEAVLAGNWAATKKYLDLQGRERALSEKVTFAGETLLQVAAGAGQVKIVKMLVKLMSPKDLEIPDKYGETALMDAVLYGTIQMAKYMIEKNSKLVSIKSDGDGLLPVTRACSEGNVHMIRYLYSVTPLEDLEPKEGDFNGVILLNSCINNKAFDIALDLLDCYPSLASATDMEGRTPIQVLATTPSAFPSGNRLVFWRRWIYDCITQKQRMEGNAVKALHKNPVPASDDSIIDIQIRDKSQPSERKNSRLEGLLQRMKTYLISCFLILKLLISYLLKLLGIQQLYAMKRIHCQAFQVLETICRQLQIDGMEKSKESATTATVSASLNGISEIVVSVTKAFPFIFDTFIGGKGENFFMMAIDVRQKKVFSLMRGLNATQRIAMRRHLDKDHNNMLHYAGMLANSTQLNRLSGAALQLQSELQWFKEVESMAGPALSEQRNDYGLTPRQFFTEQHKALRKEGEEWLRGTATSNTVVGALVLTVVFAAAFTVPGGNNQDTGYPLFLDEKLFKAFIILDAIALILSSTSVLVFLGVLTSRYAEEDFLQSLPRKMIVGLLTLFFAIAAMMLAFCAALGIILHHQKLMVILITSTAIIPIIVLAVSQIPLLRDMLASTYGSGKFNRNIKPWF